jgi:transcriptional regulator with XRE-family HTH domain
MQTVHDSQGILRSYRDALGLSQEQVARLPQFQPPLLSRTLGRWERGEVAIKYWRLAQLAQAYGLEFNELVGRLNGTK